MRAALVILVVGLACGADCHGGNVCGIDVECRLPDAGQGDGGVVERDAGFRCVDNTACPDGAECCTGECLAVEDARWLCGCTGTTPGRDCTTNGEICVFGDDPTDWTSSSCLCSCTVELGGPTCNAPADAGSPPICSCAVDADCARVEDADLERFHVAADACGADARCACGGGPACGGTAQCTSTGCITLETDSNNCGVVGHACAAGAQCIDGGCTCGSDADCDGANVDSCVGGRCICSGYNDNCFDPSSIGTASCPLGLTCTASGCVVDDVDYPQVLPLGEALGVPLSCDGA